MARDAIKSKYLRKGSCQAAMANREATLGRFSDSMNRHSESLWNFSFPFIGRFLGLLFLLKSLHVFVS